MKSILSLIALLLVLSSCSSSVQRDIASECSDNQNVEQGSYFEDYENCKGY